MVQESERKIKMKTMIKIVLTFLFPAIFLFTTGFSFAKVNANQLKNNVEKKLSGAYPEPLMISANQEGTVTVEGQVNTLFDKLKIDQLISQVKGVNNINNKIFINTEPTADNTIKDNIELELERNSSILEPEKIKVKVKHGVVNLSGTVSYLNEKVLAQSIASWQDGVTDMTSSIKVLPPTVATSDKNLKEIVGDILENHFSIEHNIKFIVRNGDVDLYGSTESMYAKNHIQKAIQHVIGVKDVLNGILVINNA